MELFESFDEGHGFSVGTTQAEQAGQIDSGIVARENLIAAEVLTNQRHLV